MTAGHSGRSRAMRARSGSAGFATTCTSAAEPTSTAAASAPVSFEKQRNVPATAAQSYRLLSIAASIAQKNTYTPKSTFTCTSVERSTG